MNIEDGNSEENLLNKNEHVNLSALESAVKQIKSEVSKIIIGQEDVVDLILIALLTKSHILLEGMPGIAKTLSSKILAQTVDADFKRIQFTPDLMPTDVLGTNVFNVKEGSFQFKAGPIFSNFVLIDEINRSPAKTQAALMEVMEERQITIDGHTYPMQDPFIVLATQNPVEQEGTYQLPEAQLDRFLFKIRMQYPSLEEEIKILHSVESDFEQNAFKTIEKVVTKELLDSCQAIIQKILIKEELISYIAELVQLTRNNPDLYLGASPRASINILKASKTIAALRGRDFVTPEDIQYVTPYVLNHRIILSPEKEMEGVSVDQMLESLISKVEVPR